MANISFTTKFDLTKSPKQFVLVDTSDYVGQGIATANVNGCFTSIIAPSGSVIYTNTDYSDSGCDIKVSTSVINQIAISLPVDSSGNVELGTYTLNYSVKDITGAPVYYTKTNVYDNEYTPVVIDILVNVNIIGQVFSQTDTTNYVVNNITPSIARTNTLIYPQGVKGGPPAPVTTTAATLTTSVFFNGPQTSNITTIVNYTFADGLMVLDSVFGSTWTDVDGTFYCSIACSLTAYANKLCGCNDTTKSIYEANYNLAASLMTNVMVNINCNGGSNISWMLDKIQDILGDCSCGCDDDDDQFSRVTGWGTILGLVGPQGPAGATGATGSAGAPGTNASNTVLYNNLAGTAHTGAYASLNSYPLAIGQLSQVGDIAVVDAVITQAQVASNDAHFKMLIAGADAMPSMAASSYLYIDAQSPFVVFKATITRISTTTVFISYKFDVNNVLPFGVLRSTEFKESSITINNMDSATNLIDLQGSTQGANTLTCNQMVVSYLKKQ